MARRKAAENETPEQTEQRRVRESIANHASRSEKVSWERQYKNMSAILENELTPVETQILDLMAKKNEIFDRIITIRNELVSDCIHPFEQLVQLDGANQYHCKFCDKRVMINDAANR
jgi:ubiquitin C-terminal hydrolase